MKKSILSIVLVLCMVLALLPAGVSAAKVVDSGNCGVIDTDERTSEGGPDVKWTLDDSGVLTISGKGEMCDYSQMIGPSPFIGSEKVRTVVVEEGVTKIGAESFVNCHNLTKVTLPASVKEIGRDAFFGCNALKEIAVSKDSKDLVSVDGVLFSKDQKTLVAYPAAKTGAYTVPESVEEVGVHAFHNAKVSEVKLGSKVTTLAYGAFQGASNLKKLQLPASLKELGGMALECQNLETLAIEDGATVPAHLNAFFEMKTAYIPKSVSMISVSYCPELKDIYFGGTEAEWNKLLFERQRAEELENINIHYSHTHDFGKMTVVTEATEDHAGLKTGTCVCSLTKEEVIPQLEPKPAENPFTDVKDGDYFFEPVLWALNHDPQITDGMTETTFAPADTCTRGQVVTFLWRAMGCEEPTKTDNAFTDVKADDYFAKAVAWAVEKGITDGTSATTFSPADPCTRAHVVTFLCRAEGNPKGGSDNPFGDVAKGEYYTDAVLWAVSQKITDGTSDTTFSPADPCTRGQIVTFLFRDLAK